MKRLLIPLLVLTAAIPRIASGLLRKFSTKPRKTTKPVSGEVCNVTSRLSF